MKYIGFITEYTKIIYSKPLRDYSFDSFFLDIEKNKILNYLENCTIIFAFMGMNKDIDDGTYFPHAFYSDGNYIWPSTLPYYLKKSNIRIDDDFLKSIIDNNYEPKKLDGEMRSLIQNELIVLFDKGIDMA